MRRAVWSVPSAAVVWCVTGFGPWFVSQDAMAPWSVRELLPMSVTGIDVVATGAVVGGVLAGLLIRRLWLAVPLTVASGIGVWLVARDQVMQRPEPPPYTEQRTVLVTLLVCTGVAAVVGALGSRRSVLAAVAIAMPVASYVLLPGNHLTDRVWVGELNGVLVAVGLAILLYVACWRSGWSALPAWPAVAAAYLTAFAAMTASRTVADGFQTGSRGTEVAAEVGTDAFVRAFRPLLELYWFWLVAGCFLAVMIVALKIRVLPPVAPEPPFEPRSNDAYLPDDLDWIDRPEPRRRLAPRRDLVG